MPTVHQKSMTAKLLAISKVFTTIEDNILKTNTLASTLTSVLLILVYYSNYIIMLNLFNINYTYVKLSYKLYVFSEYRVCRNP